MTIILKTTIATVFAAACLAGASLTFAADNGNNGGNNGGHNSGMNGGMKGANSKPGSKEGDGVLQTDPNATGSIKCDDSKADMKSGCDKPGTMKQDDQQ